MEAFPELPPSADSKAVAKLYGDIMSCGQVHLPVRMFARDMEMNGFPVLRYEIRWTPEQYRPLGYVTHGCDQVLWSLRIQSLEAGQVKVAKAWLDKIAQELGAMISGKLRYNPRCVLTLKEDMSIEWKDDAKWEQMMELHNILQLRKRDLQFVRPKL